MDLGVLMKEAGFEVDDRKINTYLPYRELPEGFQGDIWRNDMEAMDANSTPFDVESFKFKVRPFLYDSLYAWVLKNNECIRVVRNHIIKTTNERVVKHPVFHRKMIDKEFESLIKDGFNCLFFYLKWDHEENKVILKINDEKGYCDFCVKVGRSFDMLSNEGRVGFLNVIKEHSKYIPIDLTEINYPMLTFSSGSYRNSIKGARILACNRDSKDKVLTNSLKNVKISPYGYYFVRHKSDSNGNTYYKFNRDWTKE